MTKKNSNIQKLKRDRLAYRKVKKIADAQGQTFLETAHQMMDEWMTDYGFPLLDSIGEKQVTGGKSSNVRTDRKSRFIVISGGRAKPDSQMKKQDKLS